MSPNYVIVGGGLAAASAVDGIRALDAEGPITILTSERELPYHRPPLSKSFLAGRDTVEKVRVHEASWYRDNKVKVRLGQTAKSVHIGKQGVTLETGERVSYDRLLIATGSSARRLAVPGADSQGVLYLRTVDDSIALRQTIKPGTKLVIAGGGFIGMEVAMTARAAGAEVTVLEMGPVVYRAFASPELSAFFQRLLESRGIAVHLGTRVARLAATGGKVSAVVTEDGRQIPAHVVLAGVGAEPNTAWLAASGFSIERGGLIVNVRLETPGKNVWAAGDVARFPDPATKHPRRLEHWDNAQAQGTHAGRNMAGANEPYTHQSAFFSDLLETTINVLGDTEGSEAVEIEGAAEVPAPRFTARYMRGGKLVAAVLVNSASEDRTADIARLQAEIKG
jgi:3-phenylpropionate/trans-cinnamate dioxygenase ferredoxin reductase subunit